MNRDTAIIVFEAPRKKISIDLEIPLNISANDLVSALNAAFDLKIDTSDINNCFLKSEKPIVLLRGNKTLQEYGIRNGSIICFEE